MSLLIRGGTVVTADQTFRADVCATRASSRPSATSSRRRRARRIVDAGGQYVMPGGIDPHTHMELPFMGTVASEDFFTGTAAGARRRHHDDHRLRHPRPQAASCSRRTSSGAAGRRRRRPTTRSTSPSPGGATRCTTTWARCARARRQQLQALHGLQGRHHGATTRSWCRASRRAELGAMRHRARRERRAGVSAAERDSEAGHHRARGPPAVAPAGGRGRGGEPRDPHRRGARRADLHRPQVVHRVARGDHPRAAARASASSARCSPGTC